MFGRKKNNSNTQSPIDYTNWEKDLGFLNLILTRKKNITKEFVIGVYSNQLQDKDYLKDEDIEPIVSNIVSEVYSQIGTNYSKFLIEKYFGSEKNLVAYITEDVYVDLISNTINRNNGRIKTNIQKEYLKRLAVLNTGGTASKSNTPGKSSDSKQ